MLYFYKDFSFYLLSSGTPLPGPRGSSWKEGGSPVKPAEYGPNVYALGNLQRILDCSSIPLVLASSPSSFAVMYGGFQTEKRSLRISSAYYVFHREGAYLTQTANRVGRAIISFHSLKFSFFWWGAEDFFYG